MFARLRLESGIELYFLNFLPVFLTTFPGGWKEFDQRAFERGQDEKNQRCPDWPVVWYIWHLNTKAPASARGRGLLLLTAQGVPRADLMEWYHNWLHLSIVTIANDCNNGAMWGRDLWGDTICRGWWGRVGNQKARLGGRAWVFT